MGKQTNTIEEIIDRVKYLVIQITTLILLILTIVQFLTREFSSFRDLLNLEQIKQILPTLGIVVLSILCLGILIFLFTFILKRMGRRTIKLKEEVVLAFRHALESSSFNPEGLKTDKNEQSSK
jgi:uncharacterized membrane protein